MCNLLEMIGIVNYGAGNLQSLLNALEKSNHEYFMIEKGEDMSLEMDLCLFPGVGHFDHAIKNLHAKNLFEPLKQYIKSNKPYFGICIGMQVLFESSEEGELKGLCIFNDRVVKMTPNRPVPHMGWNLMYPKTYHNLDYQKHFYFVHSFAVVNKNQNWVHSTCCYGDLEFVSSIQQSNVFATQFHPEKSGKLGLELINAIVDKLPFLTVTASDFNKQDNLTKRILSCLDVREDEDGELVVTKGYGYDVRDQIDGKIRNIGNPIALSRKYYEAQVDELCFLSIKSYNTNPLDTPLMKLLRKVSKEIFVPLTIGGGISDKLVDRNGEEVLIKAVEIASAYFKAGADKVSIGSDAVKSVLKYLEKGISECGISDISKAYGNQAVVVSIDPKRHFIKETEITKIENLGFTVLTFTDKRPCYYAATIHGGRSVSPLCAIQLAKYSQILGAGELLVNCIDEDGKGNGFDLVLLKAIRSAVSIPIIASSGAGKQSHFVDAFGIDCDAALAAGIFHRDEVSIESIKEECRRNEIKTRLF